MIDVGEQVLIHGLTSTELNGLKGEVLTTQGNRYVVLINGIGERALKEDNLKLLDDDEGTQGTTKKSRTTYLVLILFCVIGVLFHKATTTRKIATQYQHIRDIEIDHGRELQAILQKDLTPPPTTAPLTNTDVIGVIFKKIAKSVGKQMFKGSNFACARLSTALMLRQAVDSGNVTWVTFGGDIPQSEFMVRCFQRMVKKTSQLAKDNKAEGNIFTVLDTDPEASIETFDERRYYRDAMKWVYQKSKSPPPLCGVTFGTYLQELPYEESIMVTNTPGSCRSIEELVCKMSKIVVQYGGPADPKTTTGTTSELYPTCYDVIERTKKKKDKD